MSLFELVSHRAEAKCELCLATHGLTIYSVPPTTGDVDQTLLVCADCSAQMTGQAEFQEKHWYCLNQSMWTPVPGVQVTAFRLLQRLRVHAWAQDLLDQLYLDDELRTLAEAVALDAPTESSDQSARTLDSNGVELVDGDAVTLIKDLEVKGANFTAKRGTLVKNISLTGDPALIEGKVNGTAIVLKTIFLKKATGA